MMKFGVISLDYEPQVRNSNRNEDYIVNIGSVMMRLMLEELLVRMGIPRNEIIKIGFHQLDSYDGDYVIVPINMHWMQDTGNKKLFNISKKIIPIFLSISLNDTNISEEQAIFLRRFEPIGCRDERTMKVLRQHNIDAYLFGCVSCILENRAFQPINGKIFFVDVPYGVKEFIPEELKNKIEFINHEMPVEQLHGMTPEEYTNTILERYRNEAELVVTSRFHGAIIPWALGIPVIVTNEAYTFRFSWIRKLFPFYTKENFQNIDWYPEWSDFGGLKKQIIENAINRITKVAEKYKFFLGLSETLELTSVEAENDTLIDYYTSAIDYINTHWDKNSKINYCFWGVNNNAVAIHNYIKDNFHNAKLVKVFDTFKTITFDGVISCSPDTIVPDGSFIFITSFVVGYVAEKFLKEKNISSQHYFICRRKYITSDDLFS